VAAAQDRSYWLDRMRLDLNALMRRPGALAVFEGVRLAYRLLGKARRTLGNLRSALESSHH
jgi:hypothetical protein